MCITFLENELIPENYFKNNYVIKIDKTEPNSKTSYAFFNIDNEGFVQYDNAILDKALDLRDDNSTKLLILLTSGPYHLLVDFLNKIIIAKEKYKNIKLYINTSMYENDENKTDFDTNFYLFLFDFLKRYNIEYVLLNDWSQTDYVVVNNFITFDKNFITSAQLDHKLFIKYFKPYIKNIDIVPTKKIYLNRKKYQNRKLYNTSLSVNQDNRIKNEEILENYLLDNGFESISLENYFNSFEEHLNYFYSTKTLVAVTSAGLTNCIYMQENTKLVELVTPQVIEISKNNNIHLAISLHSFWQAVTSTKNIDHISIGNHSRDAEYIVNKIKNNKYLEELIIG